jgi:dTDP-glucose 4,6-dehydratase
VLRPRPTDVCVDNRETGSLNNIKHIREPGFRFEMVDITEHYEIEEPIDYARLPLHTLKVGAYGTHNTGGYGRSKYATFGGERNAELAT